MNRTNQVLAAILALQIAVVAVIFWPRPAASVGGGESLLAGLEAEQVVRLTIRDADGNEMQLVKDGGRWVLPQADDFAARDNTVPQFLAKLVALKADRVVAKTSASHKRLQVAEESFNRAIALELADGTTRKLYLGTSPAYQATHVRLDGENEVYLTSGLATSDAGVQAANWIDTLYLSVPQEQVVALTVDNANGRFEFEKDDAGTWTIKGLADDETFKENAVTSLVSRVSSLRLIQPLGKTEQDEYGLEEPSATVEVQTRDEAGNTQAYTLRVGAKSDEDDSYVVISSESPYYVRVSNYTVRDFVEQERDDFVELPPTPTPEPTAEATPEPTPQPTP